MTRERAEEILAACGADPARWPADEREAVRAALSSDLPLRRQAEAAAELDAMLIGWAAHEPALGAIDPMAAADAALAAADRAPVRRNWAARAFGGAAVAAAVAVAAFVTPGLIKSPAAPVQQTAAVTPAPQASQSASVDAVDHRLWTMTFTPTPDEETLI